MNIPSRREFAGTLPPDVGWGEWLGADAVARSVEDRPWVTARTLPAERESAGIARRVTKTTLSEWRLADFSEDAAVVVSELVTNALRYGLGSGTGDLLRLVLVRYEGQLVCMVTDPGDEVPTLLEPDYVAETGRGLHIVEAISRAWGWTPLLGGGKAVWAAFAIS